jgi:hypothetical protein
MPLPVIANTIRVSCEGLSPNGTPWANVLHFRKTGALTFVGAIAVLDPLLFALFNANLGGGTSWKGQASTLHSLQRLEYTPLDGVTATTVIAHVLAGTVAAEPLPFMVSLVATLRTALRGRSFRGRSYWTGWTENTSLNGVPQAASVTAMNAQWTGFVASLVGSGVSLVVASYLLASAEDVTTVTVDGRWDTQRRRNN